MLLRQLMDGARVLNVSTLIKAHVGRGAQLKIKNGGLLNLCQFYTIVRCLLCREHTISGKMLLMARLLDSLERDYALLRQRWRAVSRRMRRDDAEVH